MRIIDLVPGDLVTLDDMYVGNYRHLYNLHIDFNVCGKFHHGELAVVLETLHISSRGLKTWLRLLTSGGSHGFISDGDDLLRV